MTDGSDPAPSPTGIVTLLTDFGLRDYYVGAVKGTLLRLTEGSLNLVDLAHELDAGDVAAGAFVLRGAWSAFPDGTVHLVVVDPGVGSERRILAVRKDGHLFVGPDNGVLDAVLDDAEVRTVTRDKLFLKAAGQTFHGRDRFAPVAAALLRGEAFDSVGPEIDDPVRLERTDPKRSEERLLGTIVHADRFGNLVTDLPASWLTDVEEAKAWIGSHYAERIVTHYAQLGPGEAGIMPGSLGTLELSLPGEPIAKTWGISVGDRVEIRLGGKIGSS